MGGSNEQYIQLCGAGEYHHCPNHHRSSARLNLSSATHNIQQPQGVHGGYNFIGVYPQGEEVATDTSGW